MAIRFPKMHIAQSVVNRILNAADEIQASAPPAPIAPVVPDPAVPETATQSAMLNDALEQPTPALPGIGDTPDPGSTASGAPLLETILEPEK